MENRAQATADRIADSGPLAKGMPLFLDAADTGKTTSMHALGGVRLDISSGWS